MTAESEKCSSPNNNQNLELKLIWKKIREQIVLKNYTKKTENEDSEKEESGTRNGDGSTSKASGTMKIGQQLVRRNYTETFEKCSRADKLIECAELDKNTEENVKSEKRSNIGQTFNKNKEAHENTKTETDLDCIKQKSADCTDQNVTDNSIPCTVDNIESDDKNLLTNSGKSDCTVEPLSAENEEENHANSQENNCGKLNTLNPAGADSENEFLENSGEKFKKYCDVIDLPSKFCKVCEMSFTNKDNLRKHARNEHGVKESRRRRKKTEIQCSYFCDLCKKGFTRKFDMEKHKRHAHSEQSSAVSKKSNLDHMNSLFKITGCNDDEIFYKCDQCDRTFKQKYSLFRHRSVHTGLKPFKCPMCQKSFRLATNCRRHVDNFHKNLKKFSCDICDKKFYNRTTLNEHVNTHTNYRPFVCEICGKSFRQKACLHTHKTFHTDVFRFSCHCGKKFRRAQELRVHSWLHTKQKTQCHKCPKCDALFKRSQSLKRHLKLHEENRCTCAECGSKFSQQRYLKMHMKFHDNKHEKGKSEEEEQLGGSV